MAADVCSTVMAKGAKESTGAAEVYVQMCKKR